MPVKIINIPPLPPFPIEVHDSSDQFLSKFVMESGLYEPTETAAVIRLLSADVDFVDLGANIGWYTLIAGISLRGRGHVHSFEPDPNNFAKLKTNVASNALDNVTIHQCAISDSPGNSLLYRSADNFGDHQLYDSGESRVAVSVEVRTLDSYPKISRQRPVIVKMDTQGSELRILRGMNTLLNHHPHEVMIMSEFWPKGLIANDTSPQEMIEFLSAAGFYPIVIDPRHHKLTLVDWSFLVQRLANDATLATGNFFDLILYRKRDGLLRGLFATS